MATAGPFVKGLRHGSFLCVQVRKQGVYHRLKVYSKRQILDGASANFRLNEFRYHIADGSFYRMEKPSDVSFLPLSDGTADCTFEVGRQKGEIVDIEIVQNSGDSYYIHVFEKESGEDKFRHTFEFDTDDFTPGFTKHKRPVRI